MGYYPGNTLEEQTMYYSGSVITSSNYNGNLIAYICKTVINPPSFDHASTNKVAIDLLDSWLTDEEADHADTLHYLREHLDESRFAERRIFA